MLFSSRSGSRRRRRRPRCGHIQRDGLKRIWWALDKERIHKIREIQDFTGDPAARSLVCQSESVCLLLCVCVCVERYFVRARNYRAPPSS